VNAWAREKELRAGSWKRAGAAGCNTKNAAGRCVYLGQAMSAAGRCAFWVRCLPSPPAPLPSDGRGESSALILILFQWARGDVTADRNVRPTMLHGRRECLGHRVATRGGRWLVRDACSLKGAGGKREMILGDWFRRRERLG
jgi:hypothetical protein